MKKKIFKIIGIVLVLFVLLLAAIPIFFQSKIGELIKSKVNNNIEATLDFASADISLLRSFPNAKVTIKNIVLLNKAPFKGDTLFASKEIGLDMSIKELFKGPNDPITIKRLYVDGAVVNVTIDKEGNANYDIAKNEDEGSGNNAETTEDSSFILAMESYEIINSKIKYVDEASKMSFVLTELDHKGAGNFSAVKSELDTKTSALVSFGIDKTNYLNKNKIALDAVIGIDLKENKYTFLENKATLNKLPLVFDGFVKVNDTNQEVNINFKTLSTEFKNFLALVPEVYSKSIKGIQTTGKFTVEGKIEGVVDETHIPKFTIKLRSNNASFKYPDLPKSVKNIFIDALVSNTTGLVEDTAVNINKLAFGIDEDRFSLTSKITNLMGNPKVKAHLVGKMNLANISKAYPVPENYDLKGVLDANVSTSFDMASIENQQYEKTQTSGKLSLKDFEYNSDELNNPVKITTTKVTFNPTTVVLNEFKGKTGKTDFAATGTIENLLGFVFKDEKIKGDFNVNSNTFALSDFMVEEDEVVSKTGSSESKPVEKLKIPSFLDANITASAATVLYDNLTLKNVKGKLRIKDEKAILSNVTSSIFGGKMGFNGTVSTKDDAPTFSMNLGMDSFKIGEALNGLEMLNVLAPAIKLLKGTLSSTLKVSGNLNDDLTPDLATISGNVLAELLSVKLDDKNEKLISAFGSKLSFLKTDKLNLNGLKTALTFENGKVKVKPFALNYDDMVVNVSGGHTFDNKLTYTAKIDVPAKYMGKDITGLIAKIDDSQLENLTIPVTASINGDFKSPVIKTDLTNGIKNLTAQLVEIQKQKLINKGKAAATDFIGGLLNKNKSATDSVSKKENTATSVIGIAEGLFGKKEGAAVKKDTTEKTNTAIKKDAVKSILGGLFGSKKKKDTVVKDSVKP